MPYLYFEAFDESWKAKYEGSRGAYWGLWDKDGNLKACMQDVFAGRRMTDNWSGNELVDGPGQPTIEFSDVPPYGSSADLKGRVRHVRPSDIVVAVYIKVGNGWWAKPYYATPTTPIWPDGTWTCDITTGGIDETATQIVAYLIPKSYTPPQMSGWSSLPAELDANALARIEATRAP